jgi:hypothetical protein
VVSSDYQQHRKPTNPPTYEEYTAIHSPNPAGRGEALLLQKAIDSPLIGKHINNMLWMVLRAHLPKFTLLASDPPVVMTNGLAHELAAAGAGAAVSAWYAGNRDWRDDPVGFANHLGRALPHTIASASSPPGSSDGGGGGGSGW